MEKEITRNKYQRIRKMAKEIATECDCSVVYVRQVLAGLRTSKTTRAEKAIKVIIVADRLSKALTTKTK